MLIDATHRIRPGMQTYPAPWHVDVCFDQLAKVRDVGRSATSVLLGTHTGTHVDAPTHFIEDTQTIDEFPTDLINGTVQVLDLRHVRQQRPLDLGAHLRAVGESLRMPRVLLVFGWSSRYGDADFYSKSPFLSESSVDELISSGIRLLAYDSPSLDDPAHGHGCQVDSPTHKALLGAGIWLLEYVNINPSQSLPAIAAMTVAPLPLTGLDGSPARCILEV